MEEDKKPGIISRIFKAIWYLILFLVPSIKILSFNGLLRRAGKITEDKWFSKQLLLNYMLALILFVPIVVGAYKTNKIYNNSKEFHAKVEKVSKDKSFFEKVDAYRSIIVLNKKDTRSDKIEKKRIQIRFLAIFIVLSTTILLQVFMSTIIIFFHPILLDSAKLKKLLISNGIIRKEDEKEAIVFATPVGFLITITGNSAKEIAYMDRIWAGLNIRIKDWIEDPEERSVVFFRKAFELQDVYIYDKL